MDAPVVMKSPPNRTWRSSASWATGLRNDPTMLGAVVGALAGLHCRMVSQSANRRNFTLVIAERDLADAMTRLHDHFFGHSHAATA